MDKRKTIVGLQNFLPKSQTFQHTHALGRVALMVMQLEHRVLSLTEKITIVLDEQQLGTLNVALEKIDL